MSPYQLVRGMRARHGQPLLALQALMDTFRAQAYAAGYQPVTEIDTPILEPVALFRRAMSQSDVVGKEMYVFTDRERQSGSPPAVLALRPEGTASVVRTAVQEGLANTALRLSYVGPMFRRERSQKGRYRQFYQAGIELFNVPYALGEIEVIVLAQEFLQACKVAEGVTLQLNTIGSAEARHRYSNQLSAYLYEHQSKLSADSQNRLQREPLRILDSKAPEDQAVIQNAPRITAFLTDSEKRRFEDVTSTLSTLGVPYVVNPYLVRGLDYYSDTVWEFTTTKLTEGAQNTVLAGGRYNGLIPLLDGPLNSSAVGWAAGLDRIALLQEALDIPYLLATRGLALVVDAKDTSSEADPTLLTPTDRQRLVLAHHLRQMGIPAFLAPGRQPPKQVRAAIEAGAQYIVGLQSSTPDQVRVRKVRPERESPVESGTLVMKPEELVGWWRSLEAGSR